MTEQPWLNTSQLNNFFVQLVYIYLNLGEQVICSIDPLFNVNMLNQSLVNIVLFKLLIVQITLVQVGFVLILLCSIDPVQVTNVHLTWIRRIRVALRKKSWTYSCYLRWSWQVYVLPRKIDINGRKARGVLFLIASFDAPSVQIPVFCLLALDLGIVAHGLRVVLRDMRVSPLQVPKNGCKSWYNVHLIKFVHNTALSYARSFFNELSPF